MTKSIKQTSNKNKKGVEELSSTKLQEDADEVVLVLDNGDEVKSDTQYQLYQWMYNKVLKKQCEAPSKPQNKHNDLRYTLELTAYDLINRFKSLKVDELCTLKLSLSYICSTLNENMANTFKNAIRNDRV
ncbi:unnamed protein product [Mucor circinelloides]